jgi:16S rRNA (uracil1498-N3)-methyltransferase
LRPDRGAAAPSFILVDELGEAGTELALPDAESHYIARVCRARAGELVRATDGRGALAELEVLEVGKVVRARIRSAERRERGRVAELWCGAPEGERADWLIEKLAELGTARAILIDTERGRWKVGAARLARWRRLAVAALRQSQQCWSMEILGATELSAALGALGAPAPAGDRRDAPSGAESTRASAHLDGGRWLADPLGTAPGPTPRFGTTLGAVGPASGFSPAERRALMERGFQPMSLAAGRLRTETAALAWAAWWAGGGGSASSLDRESRGA